MYFIRRGIESAKNMNCLIPIFMQLMVYTFDISILYNLIQQYAKFEISKVYNIRLQRYRDQKIRVCGKDSVSLNLKKNVQKVFELVNPNSSLLSLNTMLHNAYSAERNQTNHVRTVISNLLRDCSLNYTKSYI